MDETDKFHIVKIEKGLCLKSDEEVEHLMRATINLLKGKEKIEEIANMMKADKEKITNE